jgi:hypothetical protein
LASQKNIYGVAIQPPNFGLFVARVWMSRAEVETLSYNRTLIS